MVDGSQATCTPKSWPWAVSSIPMVSSETTPWHGALLRRWRGTSAEMVQLPLDQHNVVVHLGGPKRVTRRRDGPTLASVAERGSLTFVPAGTQYVWRTEGPIAFAHLYVQPGRLADVAERHLRGAAREATLVETVACRDPLLELLLERMLREVHAGAAASSLRLDSLFESALARLARAPRTISSPSWSSFFTRTPSRAAASGESTCTTRKRRRRTGNRPAPSRPGKTCPATPTCCSTRACTAPS